MNVSYHSERDPGFLWLLPLCIAIKTRVGGIVRAALLVSRRPWLASSRGREKGAFARWHFPLVREVALIARQKTWRLASFRRRGRAKMESEGPSACWQQTHYAVQSPHFFSFPFFSADLKPYTLKSIHLGGKKKKSSTKTTQLEIISEPFCIGLRFL